MLNKDLDGQVLSFPEIFLLKRSVLKYI